LSVRLGGTLGARVFSKLHPNETTRERLAEHYDNRVFRPRITEPCINKQYREVEATVKDYIEEAPCKRAVLNVLNWLTSEGLETNYDHVANFVGSLFPPFESAVEEWAAEQLWQTTFLSDCGKEEIREGALLRRFQDYLAKVAARRNQKLHQKVLNQMIGNSNSVLEAGCYMAKNLISWARENPDATTCGVDYSEEVLAEAEKKAQGLDNITFVQNDIRNLPFKDNSFDTVFNSGVLEHFIGERQAKILAEMCRVTSPGGNVIVSVPNLNSPSLRYRYFVQDFDIDPTDVSKNGAYKNWGFRYEQTMRPKELIALFEAQGLKNIKLSGWNPMKDLMTGGWLWDPENKRGTWWWDRWKKPLYPIHLQLLSFLIDFALVRPADLLTGNMVSSNFGDQVIVSGEK